MRGVFDVFARWSIVYMFVCVNSNCSHRRNGEGSEGEVLVLPRVVDIVGVLER